MKRPTIALSALACLLSIGLPVAAAAEPAITIYTDDDAYQSGDTIEVSLSAQNDGEGMSVAVYVGLLTPDGGIYTTQFDGWSERLEPWIPDIYVPSGFTMDKMPFWWFELPCSMPPIQEPGDYIFASVLTYPGTLDWVSIASLAPFTVEARDGSHYYVSLAGDDSNDGSEDAPWKTITHALASVDGSEENPATIHVAAGMYGPGPGAESFPLYMKSRVSLVGEGADATTLNCNGAAFHVIYCDNVHNLTIEGLTITGGQAIASGSDSCGAGIYCIDSSPTIANNTIMGNLARGSMFPNGLGGGIYCAGEEAPTILNNSILSNTAAAGSAVYCDGCSANIEGNEIGSNLAYWNGAICCYWASPTIANNVIDGNIAGEFLVGEGSGAGIYCDWSEPTIVNNLITRNEARFGYGGGGIFSGEGSYTTIVGNTITGNIGGHGGGVFCSGYSETTLCDCIIWGNGDDLSGGSATYCCIQDMVEGQGNIHENPVFVAGPLGDYYLHPDSPCIDAGSQSASAAGLSDWTTQTDGTPDTGVVDMGYHYPIP